MALWFVIIALVIAAIVWIVRSAWSAEEELPPPERGRLSGLDILGERYARGEISREEYLQKKADLRA